MNNKFLKKILRSLIKGKSNVRSFARKRIPRRANPIKRNINMMGTSLGRQFRTSLVTKLIVGPLNTPTTIQIDDLIMTTEEWLEIHNLWKYVKVQGFTITVEPNNLNTSSRPLYMRLNFGYGTISHIRLNDDVKVIPAYRTRFFQYHWRVPELNSGLGLMNKFTDTSTFQMPGNLQLYSPENTDTWHLRVDVKLKFRGAILQPETKGLSVIYIKNDKLGTLEETPVKTSEKEYVKEVFDENLLGPPKYLKSLDTNLEDRNHLTELNVMDEKRANLPLKKSNSEPILRDNSLNCDWREFKQHLVTCTMVNQDH